MRRAFYLALAAVAACTAFGTEGASPPAAMGTPTDGGSTSDASSSDGGSSDGEGGLENASLCATDPATFLCADFDPNDPLALMRPPTRPDVLQHMRGTAPDGGTGNALRFSFTGAQEDAFPDERGAFRVEIAGPLKFNRATASFRINVETSNIEFARLAGFVYRAPSAHDSFSLTMFGKRNGPSGYALDGDTEGAGAFGGKDGDWHKVTIVVDHTPGTPGKLGWFILIDDASAGLHVAEEDCDDAAGALDFVVGVYDTSVNAGETLAYWLDDLRVNLE